jgi:hypothetical protein
MASAEEPVLKLRATVVGTAEAPLTIQLLRWSTDAERAPLLAALSAPPQPAAPAVAEASAFAGATAGRSAGAETAAPARGRGGRAGRGGRGASPPSSPAARLTAAVKAAPTVGFIWGDGPTGYSIKYAWRSASPGAPERVVLVTDRRLGSHSTSWPVTEVPATADEAEFTVVEMRIDAKGLGEAKVAPTSPVVDAAANTLALDRYDAAPVLLRVTR